MLLRRITDHVRAQNWFAVGIDLIIVVIGVYIGIQVSNWNDSVRAQSLEYSYLQRMADELRSNTQLFEAEAKSARESRKQIREFALVLNSPTSDDADLVRHTSNFITRGTIVAAFNPSQTTIDELKATGNLDIIRDPELRQALVALHAYYDDGIGIFETNNNWVLQMEDTVFLGLDALRFDPRTSMLFPDQSTDASAQYIRSNSDLLTRHAALHFFIKDRAVEVLDEAIVRSSDALKRLEKQL